MLGLIRKPYRWVTSQFPGLDFRSTFITISGCILLILYLYYGKPGHFFKYFPEYAKSLGTTRPPWPPTSTLTW